MMLRAAVLFSFLFPTLCFASLPALADPSSRVGRIASIQGAVTLVHPSTGEAQQATLNWPITADNEVITDSFSRTELRLGAAAIRVGSNTDLSITRLDDNQVRLRLNRGSIAVQVRSSTLARELALDIAQGQLFFNEAANVRIDTRDDNNVTAINVMSGAANFDSGSTRFSITAGRRAEVDGSGLRTMESRNNFRDDAFDAWNTERDRQAYQGSTPRYASPDMNGIEVLESYGTWRTTTTYGAVWSPTVIPVGWAPYRDGRWVWISPWGWTWVDNAPWGYAPSHYGRWVFYDQRWCWTPGAYSSRPIWAPALVGWVGGSGWQVADYRDGAAIGWFPLAPREVYVPIYPVSSRYLQQINNGYPINVNAALQTGRNADPRTVAYQNQFVRDAVTVMPSYQFGSSKTVVVAPSTLRGNQAQVIQSMPATSVAPVATRTPDPRSAAPPSYREARPQAVVGPVVRSYSNNTPITSLPTPPATNIAQPSVHSSLATVVVRPAETAPQAMPPAVVRSVTVNSINAAPAAAPQRSEEQNKAQADQRRRLTLGGNGALDNPGIREGSGRASLQR